MTAAATAVSSDELLPISSAACHRCVPFALPPATCMHAHTRSLPCACCLLQAVTCDDFLSAMADANGEDLSALGRWYTQAGTPRLAVAAAYSPTDKTYTLTFKQVRAGYSCSALPCPAMICAP